MLFTSSSAQDAVLAAAVIALVPQVAAHGYVAAITAGGKTYQGSNPNWYYQPSGQVVPTAGWFALNQDNGFVSPSAYGTSDIGCHKSGKAGNQQIPVAAGSSVVLNWNTWPISHHGPVIDYLAKCSGNCTALTDASSLSFFKIAQSGLLNDDSPPGTWATDAITVAPYAWTIKIPSSVAPGNYVLRHELIGLHAAGSSNGAQNYPQCINLQITGSGTATPSGTKATALYKSTDPGILIDIYSKISSYTIPGPTFTSIKKMARHARDFVLDA
nr:hypothetical protein B0A51_01571 [Rachicladosporium sp. CCFEE 5018]